MLSGGQQSGFMYLNLKSNTKVSLAVVLRDDYNVDSPPVDQQIKVFLKEIPVQCVKNLSGYYVFANLPENLYTVCVTSQYYHYIEQQVDISKLDPSDPVLNIKLIPNPYYLFPSKATLIRAMVSDPKGIAVQGARVTAVPLTGNTAKIASKGAKAGDEEIGLVSVNRRIFPGDAFLIDDKDEAKKEHCVVAGLITNQAGVQTYRLAEKLKSGHSKGGALIPAVSTSTVANGEMVIYFRDTFAKKFAVQMEIKYQDRVIVQEVQIMEGTTVSLGNICL